MSVAIAHDLDHASPFHAGEQALQEQSGMRQQSETFGQRAIRSYMPDQHREFFAQLPFMIVGSVDESGWPWASVLSGRPGFVASPDPTTLTLNASAIAGDPLHQNIALNAPLGLLGIELDTRRRNRLNARISQIKDNQLTVNVDQSFGNCPQYIQLRDVDFVREPTLTCEPDSITPFNTLDSEARYMISQADTFFVASYIDSTDRPDIEGVDVSHRGGKPGFVKVDGNTLTIPDYPGNFYFNTLGNFLLNPKAGLVFIDFESGDVLQLTGRVELIDANDPVIQAYEGAERGWRVIVDHGQRLGAALPFRSTLKEYSPSLSIAGDWQQAETSLAASTKQQAWRRFKLVRTEDESSVIRSFYFEPADEPRLPAHQAGQFLTLRVTPQGCDKPLVRTYTLSNAPGTSHYRLSIKREAEGQVSQYLHDHLQVDDIIEARAPSGDFTIDASEVRPAVLISGGVGVTPMIAMAEHIASEGLRTGHRRKLTVIQAAQNSEQRAFAERFRTLASASDGSLRYVSYLDQPNAEPLTDERNGFVTADELRQLLALDDYDFYLCGPPAFMQALYDALRALGVRDVRIFAEAFGPASLIRQPDQGSTFEPVKEADEALIQFDTSGFEQRWSAGDSTLLEVAEEHGLTPEFGCRSGSCGSCATKLLSGSVAYRNRPSAAHADDEVLICCAVPAHGSDTLTLAL